MHNYYESQIDKNTRISMSVQCHYKYNSELQHVRMGEYKKTDDDK